MVWYKLRITSHLGKAFPSLSYTMEGAGRSVTPLNERRIRAEGARRCIWCPLAAHAGTWTVAEVAVRLLGRDIRRGTMSPTPKHGQPPLGDGSVSPKPVMKADPHEGGGVATATLNHFPPRPIGLRGHIEQF
jgi:hypothetical protein